MVGGSGYRDRDCAALVTGELANVAGGQWPVDCYSPGCRGSRLGGLRRDWDRSGDACARDRGPPRGALGLAAGLLAASNLCLGLVVAVSKWQLCAF